ncbi:putative membrane protein [Abditibacterium utsteinense]|uniref:Putative membrane protein n=2 Tax=Abditibacterium utsteinense TaxID=1960156 RepID=A0A2S8SWL5_9BACT|nr:putative membrane protein [Abditibacterium utsteinense]
MKRSSTMNEKTSRTLDMPAPRWTIIFALAAVAALYAALPTRLLVGPRYLLAALIALLTLPTIWSHRTGRHDINQILGYLINGIETFALVASVVLLLSGLSTHRDTPLQLLRGAGVLWLSNIFIFALWYWRLDAGGPHRRDAKPGHRQGAFQFPQMSLGEDDANFDPNWSPDFIDYLFLAFNSSTALSPTDAPVFSRWAKILMMLQALISLALVAVLAARAVNGL